MSPSRRGPLKKLVLLRPWRRPALPATARSSTLVPIAMRSAHPRAAEVSSGVPTAAVSCFAPPELVLWMGVKFVDWDEIVKKKATFN